jgi:hypothetical protein
MQKNSTNAILASTEHSDDRLSYYSPAEFCAQLHNLYVPNCARITTAQQSDWMKAGELSYVTTCYNRDERKLDRRKQQTVVIHCYNGNTVHSH